MPFWAFSDTTGRLLERFKLPFLDLADTLVGGWWWVLCLKVRHAKALTNKQYMKKNSLILVYMIIYSTKTNEVS